jgi:predicted dehydrogenase
MSKSNRKVRYAVVGLGHLTQVAVLPAFARAQNSEVVALVSDDPEKLSTLGRRYGAKRLYSYEEYEKALADVDAAYIVLPNHLHREFTVRAAEAGAHVLCEKPMAATVKDCKAMIAAARRHKRKLMIAYRLHFERANLEAIDIARRKLGELRFFSSDFAQQVIPDNIRRSEPVAKGGGPIYDMGVYCINAARYLFRAEPVEVFAASASRRGFNDPEEMTSVVLRFPADRMATFTASFGAADIGRYTLTGTKGTLTADPGYEYAEGIDLEIKREGKSTKREYPKRDQFAAEISYFSDCILKNKEPEPNGEEGMADVRIIEAIYKSARSGKVVRLESFSRKQRPSLKQEVRRRPHGMPETVHVESPSGEAA